MEKKEKTRSSGSAGRPDRCARTPGKGCWEASWRFISGHSENRPAVAPWLRPWDGWSGPGGIRCCIPCSGK